MIIKHSIYFHWYADHTNDINYWSWWHGPPFILSDLHLAKKLFQIIQVKRATGYNVLHNLSSLLTWHDGLFQRNILQVILGNSFEKGKYFQEILGRLLDWRSVYHSLSGVNFFQSNQQWESTTTRGSSWSIKLVPKPVKERAKTYFPLRKVYHGCWLAQLIEWASHVQSFCSH